MFANTWLKFVRLNTTANNEELKAMRQEIVSKINDILANKTTVSFRVALSPFPNCKDELLIKNGNTCYDYEYFVKKFEHCNNATQWIHDFLCNDIDIDNNCYNLPNNIFNDVQTFVGIVVIAERARMYTDYDNLIIFLENVLNGKKKWNELKENYHPSLKYREDMMNWEDNWQ